MVAGPAILVAALAALGRSAKESVIILFPFSAILVIAFLFRHDLGVRALLIYGGIWILGLATVLLFGLSPGVFVAAQCLLAIVMLLHVGVNPEVPRL